MSKSKVHSDACRCDGNNFYARRSFYEALLKYNESLCCAEPESENLGLAFANRSAVYFEMKLYERCLENINFARRHRYPEKDLDVLKRREEKCLEQMKHSRDEMKSTDCSHLLKLSYPKNQKLPYIADCLEFKVDKKFGRHVITNRPLRVGDIVAIEEPFVKIIHERFVHQKCAGCFKDNLLDLFPCKKCQKAMFCSSECEQSSWSSYHQYECAAMDLILGPLMTSTMRIALRTFFTVLSLFSGSIEELEKFLSQNTEPRTVFDGESDAKLKFLSTHSLMSNGEVAVNETVFEEIFQASPVTKEIWISHNQVIRSFLKKQTQIGTMNYHEIHGWPLRKGGLPDDELNEFKNSLAYQRGITSIGSGSYPFIALLNHHCSPNVNRIFIDDKNVLIVQRPIEKGAQLFDNYGYNFTNTARDYRRSELFKRYKFKCDCDACANNWPLLPSLKILDKSSFSKAKKSCQDLKLAGLNQKKAREKFKELSERIEKGQKNFPSMEICSMMESATAFLELSTKPNVQF